MLPLPLLLPLLVPMLVPLLLTLLLTLLLPLPFLLRNRGVRPWSPAKIKHK